MLYLLAVSLIWGFSFGLVKAEFSDLSGPTLAMMRMLIALPCFLPFLKRIHRVPSLLNLQLLGIGAIQYGLMYVCLFSAFRYLSGYEVALLTIFTPLPSGLVLADRPPCGRRRPVGFSSPIDPAKAAGHSPDAGGKPVFRGRAGGLAFPPGTASLNG